VIALNATRLHAQGVQQMQECAIDKPGGAFQDATNEKENQKKR
jgi:hypothetical protein